MIHYSVITVIKPTVRIHILLSTNQNEQITGGAQPTYVIQHLSTYAHTHIQHVTDTRFDPTTRYMEFHMLMAHISGPIGHEGLS